MPRRHGAARRPARCSRSCSARARMRRARPRAQKLLNWGFQAFDTVRLYQSGKQVIDAAGLEGRRAGRAGRLSRRPLPHPAEGQGGQARGHDAGGGAAGGADRRGPARGHGQGRARRQAGRRVSDDRARGRAAPRAASAAPGTASGYGSRNEAAACDDDPLVYLNGKYLPVSRRRRSRCSTAASSTATASTSWCPSTGASRSACRSISRGCSAASTASASPTRTPRAVGVDHPRARRAPAVRRPGRVFPGDSRRRPSATTRSPRASADGVHDEQPAAAAVARAGGQRRRLRHRRRQPLAAVRHQDDLARSATC